VGVQGVATVKMFDDYGWVHWVVMMFLLVVVVLMIMLIELG
jgi:hypothetical protein